MNSVNRNCKKHRMPENHSSRTVAISFHNSRTLPLSDICKDRTSVKPVILSALNVYSNIRNQITIIITYCGTPVDTIPIRLEIGNNKIPIRKISMIVASGITQWSTIEFIPETPMSPAHAPYELTVEFTLCNPEHSSEDIRQYAHRVYENRTLMNNFIEYLTEEP